MAFHFAEVREYPYHGVCVGWDADVGAKLVAPLARNIAWGHANVDDTDSVWADTFTLNCGLPGRLANGDEVAD
jgi:hypothetical protein